MDYSLTSVAFDALPGWKQDDPSPLFESMRRCREYIRGVRHYRTGAFGLSAQVLEAEFSHAANIQLLNAESARQFFEERFQPFLIRPKGSDHGFVTAFYEPEVDVSDKPDAAFRFPFYRRPDDLVDLDDQNRPDDLDASYVFGRESDGRIVPYFDRSEIDRGALEGRGLEIAWASSRVDVFFAHVQGAARLNFRDGTQRRITYAAKAGHPFTGIGRYLISKGEIGEDLISMDAIRDWLAAHPKRIDEVLWQNRSYIFFREAEVADPALGPIAAAKVPLIPMRSIAVDRLIHTFSSLFYIHAPSITHLTDGKPFQRLMMALDTGTAIVGPARGDIFTGSGEQAGHLAGNVRNSADFYILVPKTVAGEFDRGE